MNENTELMAPVQDAINEFKRLFHLSMDYLEEAARVYVEAIDQDPDCKKEFVAQLPNIPPQAWNSIEAVGRGSLDKRLLVMDAHRVKRLTRLSKSDQALLLDGNMELALNNGDTIMIRVKEATAQQLDQVIGPNGIRTVQEQRTYLRAKEQEPRGHGNTIIARLAKKADAEARGYMITDDGNILILRDPPVLRPDELEAARKELRNGKKD